MRTTKKVDRFATLFFRKLYEQIQKSWGNQPKPICPYCKGVLEKAPCRKKKCPFCGNYIYVRTHPNTHRRLLVTKKKADEINILWEKRAERKERSNFLEEHKLTNRDYERHQARLFQKWGKEPSQQDVFWSILNDLVVKRENLSEKANLYYEMALFLDKEGRDFSEILKQHHQMVLLDLRQNGYTEVKILSSGGCAACKAQDGKIYIINQALQEMPLPCKKCSFFMNSQKCFCRCLYQAVEDGWWQIGNRRLWVG